MLCDLELVVQLIRIPLYYVILYYNIKILISQSLQKLQINIFWHKNKQQKYVKINIKTQLLTLEIFRFFVVWNKFLEIGLFIAVPIRLVKVEADSDSKLWFFYLELRYRLVARLFLSKFILHFTDLRMRKPGLVSNSCSLYFYK